MPNKWALWKNDISVIGTLLVAVAAEEGGERCHRPGPQVSRGLRRTVGRNRKTDQFKFPKSQNSNLKNKLVNYLML